MKSLKDLNDAVVTALENAKYNDGVRACLESVEESLYIDTSLETSSK